MKNEINASDNQDHQPKSSLMKKLGKLIGRSPIVLEAELIAHTAAIKEAQEQGITNTISRLDSTEGIYTMELTQLHTDGALSISEMVAPYPSQVRVSVLRSLDDVVILVTKNASILDDEGCMTSRYYNVELRPHGEVSVHAKDKRDAIITGLNLKTANSRGQDIAVGPDSFIATLSDSRVDDSYPSADDNLDIQPQVLLVKHALAAVELYESQ